MSLWEAVAGLELRVDDYALERRESTTPSGWTRVTTTVVLSGDGETGRGEDVTYEAEMHDGVPAELMLAGTWSLEDFSHKLDDFEELGEGYRRWAFESAALDLALRLGELAFGEALGRRSAGSRSRPSSSSSSTPRRTGIVSSFEGCANSTASASSTSRPTTAARASISRPIRSCTARSRRSCPRSSSRTPGWTTASARRSPAPRIGSASTLPCTLWPT